MPKKKPDHPPAPECLPCDVGCREDFVFGSEQSPQLQARHQTAKLTLTFQFLFCVLLSWWLGYLGLSLSRHTEGRTEVE